VLKEIVSVRITDPLLMTSFSLTECNIPKRVPYFGLTKDQIQGLEVVNITFRRGKWPIYNTLKSVGHLISGIKKCGPCDITPFRTTILEGPKTRQLNTATPKWTILVPSETP